MVKWFKIPRLLRVGRILKQLKGYARFYKVFLAIALLIWCVHFMGCVWMSIIDPCGDDYYFKASGHCTNVWDLYAVALDHGIGAVMGTSTTLYRADHEWITERMTNSKASVLHIFHFGSSVMGILNIAWIFGECATILGHSDPYGWNYFGRVDRIKHEMALHKLPENLMEEIQAYYNYMYMNNRHGATQLLCDPDMSDSLRKRISIHMHRSILLHCSFFVGSSQRCLEMACERLKFEVHLPKTILIAAGDAVTQRSISQMFIVGRGILSVIQGKPHVDPSKDITISELHEGECFGEIALLHPNQTRNSTVMSMTIVELYSLTDHDFKDLLVSFPSFADAMKTVSTRRISELNLMASEKGAAPLISMPAITEGKIVTEGLMNISPPSTDIEQRLEDLQHGITNIMHHLRMINRKG
jgi:CRP-like cAMP-binding protein